MSNSIDQLQATVRELQDREAIKQCVFRYCRGADRLDRELMASAYHADGIEEHGKFVGNGIEFVDFALQQHIDAHLSTQHYVHNHMCEIDGDTAHTETYFMFVAMNKRGKILQMNGGRYVDRFERRLGVWESAFRVCLRDWATMDERPNMNDLSSFTSTRAIMSEEARAFMNGGLGSRRDRSDPSYLRPIVANRERVEAYKRQEK